MSKRRRRAREKQVRHALTESVRPRTIAAGSGLAVAASLVSGSVAMAASTFDVDTNVDDGTLAACTTADDDCSLRGAIGRANADPGSTITFASTVTGSILLLSDLPSIGAGQTILGPGANVLTIDDGNHNGLSVDTGSGDVTISDLTVADSKYQGITSNGAGALTLSRMTLSGNGGNGVRANSPLAIDHSTISGNGKYAGDPGCGCSGPGPETAFGVYATAGLTMENSTVAYSGSIFTKYGGGVRVSHGGTIENSTIARNGPQTGVGIAADGAYALTLSSTIVAGNAGASLGGDVTVTNGGTVTENFSLIQNTTGLPALEAGSGDNLNGEDPQFLSTPPIMDDNGGPTRTIKPTAASPVIDKGKDFVGTGKDQRGIALFDAPGIPNAADGRDMGAVEVQVPSVSSISPDHADAGDTVQIIGKDLSGATGVKFGSVDATSFTVVDDKHVNAVVPAGSGTVDATVTTPVGTSPTAAGDRFTYGYQVDTKSDDVALTACTADHDDDCSLRGAITAANANPIAGTTITFAPSVTGDITPGSLLPIVSKAETIVGPGANVLAIDATGLASGLRADTTNSQVSISGLTVKGADNFNFYSSGTGGPLVLSNVASSGSPLKGVQSLNDVTISGSTISGNHIALDAYAGVQIQNSTVSGNTDNGVILHKGGTLKNSTISGNGSGVGVSDGYALDLQSTIVAGNSSYDVDAGTSTVTENFSLVQNDSGLTLQPASGDNLNGQDPQLGALADNGGPTKTQKPATTSPVIDQGTDAAGTGKDQRGFGLYDNPSATNAADGRDIGAVELTVPSVSSISPTTGNAGDTVTITGANLTRATGVKFGDTDATGVHVVDDTHVTAVAPAGSGTVDVTVVAPDGTSPTVANDKFRYLAPPAVSSLSPTSGNAGDTVTITGTNFTGATGVKFGDTDATSFTVVDATHVTAVAPAGSGSVDVRVIAPDGTSATGAGDRFRYLAAPAVSSLSPDHGRAGDTVTITGTNFNGATGVKFGATDATSFTVADGTHVTAVAPAGSGAVDVTVITPDGTSPTGAGDKFTYDPEPPKPPAHLTDAQVLALMRRPLFSAHFVTKPKTLVFKDRLPEKGTARYNLILLKDRPSRRADRRSSLGDVAVVPSGGARTAKITIQLSGRGWRILRRNPAGTLVIHTSFKRKFNGHVIRTSRPIEPENRPSG